MKKILASALFIVAISYGANAQNLRINGYAAYLFDDNVDSYYDVNSYYNGKIEGGFQWGVGLEFMVKPTKGIELKYLRQDTKVPMNYYDAGAKFKEFDVAINYILIGGSNYFDVSSEKVEPYLGLELGAAIIDVKNATNSSSAKTKFAWGIKGGTNIWLSDKVGLKIQAELLSAVQSAGGGLYFGTGGVGAGVSTYSTMYQFGIGGGITIKTGQGKK